MILELVAGRIIAPYVGVSLYTWTSVIGVILAGLTLGNFVGGRLADRWPSPKLLGVVYLVAGLLSLVILSIDGTHRALAINELIEGEQHVVIPILFLTGALFFLPAAALGAISPIIVKLTVRDLARTGSTVGASTASARSAASRARSQPGSGSSHDSARIGLCLAWPSCCCFWACFFS